MSYPRVRLDDTSVWQRLEPLRALGDEFLKKKTEESLSHVWFGLTIEDLSKFLECVLESSAAA